MVGGRKGRSVRRLLVIEAPSNLGLRPPAVGSVPGCYKAGWALREAGLFGGLEAQDFGVVVPPRYSATFPSADGNRNLDALAHYSKQLADRLGPMLEENGLIVVVGGDCSILIGEAVALHRRGRFGLVFLDGHSDFRHLGNSPVTGAAAGEDLAIVTGRGDDVLTNIEGNRPYFRDEDVLVVGTRPEDEAVEELAALGIDVLSAASLRESPDSVHKALLAHLDRSELDGFWVHLDVDVLDSTAMPAVDSPSEGGLTLSELQALLGTTVAHPMVAGIDICIFDPDLDPTRSVARDLAATLNAALGDTA